jgi:excisionase family DNA binding protein
MKKLLTIADFMALYRVSRSTVYRLFAKGNLTPVKIGSATRIHSDEAANWLAGLMAGRT